LSKTRFRKDIAFVGTASAQGTMYAASLAVVTTFTPPAQSIDLGSTTHGGETSKLNGVYLSFAFGATAAVAVAVTHGFGSTIKGWIPVNKSASYGIWCSNIAATTSTLSLKAGGTMTARIFAF